MPPLYRCCPLTCTETFQTPPVAAAAEGKAMSLLPARLPPTWTEVTQGNSSRSLRHEKAGLANTTKQGKGKGRQPGCKTRPLPFSPSFWGFQAALFTQVQQSRNTCCLFQPGITPELINLADQSWLSALWFWKHDADKWKLALERASMNLGFINSGFAPCRKIKSGPRD